MAGAAPTGRWAIITPDGSIATTRRPAGSCGAGSRAEVDDGDRVAQRVVDQARDPRVSVAGGRVGAADGVVER
jgi:hypothetical protein